MPLSVFFKKPRSMKMLMFEPQRKRYRNPIAVEQEAQQHELTRDLTRPEASDSLGPSAANGYNAAMRFRLRTLLIVLALGPPLLAAGHWVWGRPYSPPVHSISYFRSGAGPGHLFIDGKEYPATLLDDPDWEERLDDQ